MHLVRSVTIGSYCILVVVLLSSTLAASVVIIGRTSFSQRSLLSSSAFINKRPLHYQRQRAISTPISKSNPSPSILITTTSMSSSSTSSSVTSPTTLMPYLPTFKQQSTLILASKSPRRQEIIGLMGFGAGSFEIIPSTFPEDLDKASFKNPADYAVLNAELKAKEVAERLFAQEAKGGGEGEGGKKRSIVVIGSDTIVDLDGKILEKPDDAEHAFKMIRTLAGREHLVHSGVAIFTSLGPKGNDGASQPVVRFAETAHVTFAPLSDEEIWSYVRSGEPMDKAGAYGIQGLGGQFVQGIKGCYFTVMGLPMHKLSAALAQLVKDELV